MTLSSSPCICWNTQPMEKLLTSVSRTKPLSSMGIAKTGALMRHFFKVWKLLSCCDPSQSERSSLSARAKVGQYQQMTLCAANNSSPKQQMCTLQSSSEDVATQLQPGVSPCLAQFRLRRRCCPETWLSAETGSTCLAWASSQFPWGGQRLTAITADVAWR